MAPDGISTREFNKWPSENAEQDQSARMCRLILLYTLRKNNLISRRESGQFTRTIAPPPPDIFTPPRKGLG